jgi:hypothetical protein
VPWHRHARAGAQLPQRRPPGIREEGVVVGRAHRLAGCQGEPPDRSHPGREDVRQVPAHIPQRLVERPHRHVARARVIELAHCRLRAGVGSQDPGVGGQAARFPQVGHLRALVGALLGPRLSWLIAMTGTSSSLASSLRARENSDTSCWRLSTRLPEDISCR